MVTITQVNYGGNYLPTKWFHTCVDSEMLEHALFAAELLAAAGVLAHELCESGLLVLLLEDAGLLDTWKVSHG